MNNIILLNKYKKEKEINKEIIEYFIKTNSTKDKEDMYKIDIILELVKGLNINNIKELINIINNRFNLD